MSYAAIDPVIESWATEHGLLVLRETNDIHRRFAHMSSPAGETFQIVIEPERNGAVRIDAHLIETWGEYEVHYIWDVSTGSLQTVLEACCSTIEIWFGRAER